jgi:hypothetical protein
MTGDALPIMFTADEEIDDLWLLLAQAQRRHDRALSRGDATAAARHRDIRDALLELRERKRCKRWGHTA